MGAVSRMHNVEGGIKGMRREINPWYVCIKSDVSEKFKWLLESDPADIAICREMDYVPVYTGSEKLQLQFTSSSNFSPRFPFFKFLF